MRYVLSAVLIAIAAPAAAEPYLSVRTGLKCSQCHTNVTGGGNRTAFGAIFAQMQLPMRPAGSVVGKNLADFLSVGFDLRFQASGTFQESTPQSTLGLEEAQAYVAARLLDERIVLYIDQTVGPDRAVAREAFGMVRRLPGNGYVKAGKFLLPYGLRLQDNAEYIREVTGYSYYTPDQGVEAGFEPGPLTVSLALTNGTAGAAENDNGKQISSTASLIFRHWRIGVSAARNAKAESRRDLVGSHAGIGIGPLALLGEVDYVRDTPVEGDTLGQFIAFGEADVLLTRGLNAKVTYGYFDKNLDVAEDQKVRARFGLEFFPVPFVRLASFYTLLADIPQATSDLDRWTVEGHLLF